MARRRGLGENRRVPKPFASSGGCCAHANSRSCLQPWEEEENVCYVDWHICLLEIKPLSFPLRAFGPVVQQVVYSHKTCTERGLG
jgi:hypothetical protein